MNKLAKENIEKFFSEAEKFRNANNFTRAIEFYEKVLYLNHNFKPALINIANCYFQLNRFDLVKKYYLDFLKIEPLNIQILNNLSLIYFKTKNIDKALSVLQKSLDIKIDQENIVEKIGYCMFELKLYSDLNLFCEKFLKKYPENKFLLSYYEKSLFKLGKNVEALKISQKQTGSIEFEDDEVKLI